MAKIYKHKFGTEEFPVPIADKITGKITWLASERTQFISRLCATNRKKPSTAASSAML